jgi:hypothetical protein
MDTEDFGGLPFDGIDGINVDDFLNIDDATINNFDENIFGCGQFDNFGFGLEPYSNDVALNG